MPKFKLLNRKDAPLELKEIGLRIKLGFVMPEHVAELQGLFARSKNADITVGIYALREIISDLVLEGESINPQYLGYNIDTNDADSTILLKGISALVIQELLVSDAIKKKSGTEPSPTTPESDAPTVPSS